MILMIISHALNVTTVISFLIEFHQNRMRFIFISLLVTLKDTLTAKNMGISFSTLTTNIPAIFIKESTPPPPPGKGGTMKIQHLNILGLQRLAAPKSFPGRCPCPANMIPLPNTIPPPPPPPQHTQSHATQPLLELRGSLWP